MSDQPGKESLDAGQLAAIWMAVIMTVGLCVMLFGIFNAELALNLILVAIVFFGWRIASQLSVLRR